MGRGGLYVAVSRPGPDSCTRVVIGKFFFFVRKQPPGCTHPVDQTQFVERDPGRQKFIAQRHQRRFVSEHELFGRLFDERLRFRLTYEQIHSHSGN